MTVDGIFGRGQSAVEVKFTMVVGDITVAVVSDGQRAERLIVFTVMALYFAL